jgi:hypothetical protein
MKDRNGAEVIGIDLIQQGLKSFRYKMMMVGVCAFWIGVGVTALILYAIGWRMI